MVFDYLVLITYAVIATLWMMYVSDGQIDDIAVFMAGFWAAGLGVFVAMMLAMRKERGRKQER